MLRKLILLTGDICLLLIVIYLSIVIVFSHNSHIPIYDSYYNMLPVMIVATGVLFNINGLFSLARKKYSDLLLILE